MHHYNVTDIGGNVARSVNQNDRYGRSDSDRITRRGTRFVRQIIAAITDSVPFNRVVMPFYITLKTNKIAAHLSQSYTYICREKTCIYKTLEGKKKHAIKCPSDIRRRIKIFF